MIAKEDRRVRKTKDALRSGLLQLMKKKPINEITVKELTELVDINRATFYNHYRDIYDLLASIEKEMYEEIQRTLNRYTLNKEIYQQRISFSAGQTPLPLFLEIFHFLVENLEMCLFLLNDKGDSEFIEKVLNYGKHKYIEEWQKIYHVQNLELLEATYAFIASGFMGLIRYWLANGMKQSPQEMASIAEKVILMSMKMFEK